MEVQEGGYVDWNEQDGEMSNLVNTKHGNGQEVGSLLQIPDRLESTGINKLASEKYLRYNLLFQHQKEPYLTP